jgi:hypothetical protein
MIITVVWQHDHGTNQQQSSPMLVVDAFIPTPLATSSTVTGNNRIFQQNHHHHHHRRRRHQQQQKYHPQSVSVVNLMMKEDVSSSDGSHEYTTMMLSRRNLFKTIPPTTIMAAAIMAQTTASFPQSAIAVSATTTITSNDDAATLKSYLYRILRVREATQQERRLILTGKFRDSQRANVKLAIKFMVQNYRLADCVVGASAYLSGGNTQQMRAIDVGQTAVQNLQTILEYFDTSDVENIKVRIYYHKKEEGGYVFVFCGWPMVNVLCCICSFSPC